MFVHVYHTKIVVKWLRTSIQQCHSVTHKLCPYYRMWSPLNHILSQINPVHTLHPISFRATSTLSSNVCPCLPTECILQGKPDPVPLWQQTWLAPVLNLGCRGVKPATDNLSYGMLNQPPRCSSLSTWDWVYSYIKIQVNYSSVHFDHHVF
jgi:hypothetical protein